MTEQELRQKLYPFTSHYLDLDGHRLHYLDEGKGPPLLLLHGNPTWSFYYRALVKALRDRYRVIVPDHMGCGFSDKPQDYPYRLRTHVDNLQRLLDQLQLPAFHLGVHDWGGPIGLGVAVERPREVRSLTVFNTTCELTANYPKRILVCKWPLLGEIGIRGLNGFARAALRMASCNEARMTPEVRAGYLFPYDSYANRIANLRFVQDIPLDESHPSWDAGKRIMMHLPRLGAVPKLILWGGRDFCFDERFLESWLHQFPDAEYHVFPEAGHYVVEDACDEILPRLERFLESQDG